MLSPKTPGQLQTASDFLEFFEAIPDEKWCEGAFVEGERRCAGGHLGMTKNRDVGVYWALTGIIDRPTEINDGRNPDYRQPTPKARICAALRDAIAKGK